METWKRHKVHGDLVKINIESALKSGGTAHRQNSSYHGYDTKHTHSPCQVEKKVGHNVACVF